MFRARVVARALLVGALSVSAACSDDDVTVPQTAATVDVTPHLAAVRAGQTQQLTAQAKDANGNNMTNDQVVWTSLDTNVATVNQSGLVTVLASGGTAIVATTRGASGFASIDAVGNVASVSITGSAGSLGVAQSVQLTALPLEANGRELFRPVTWSSSNPSVATISSTGLLTTVTVGTTTITATSEGKSASLPFTVLPPPPVATVALSPSSGFLPTNVAVPLALTLRDANNVLLNNRVVAWTASNANATVSATGVVTAVSSGPVTITATSEGKSGTATFTAIPGLRSAVGVVFANPTAGTQAQFAVYVPAGTTSLNVTLRNGTGDPDLYLYRPGNLNTAVDDCHSFNDGPTENCTVTNPAAGVWWILVDAFIAHSGTTITATLTPTPP